MKSCKDQISQLVFSLGEKNCWIPFKRRCSAVFFQKGVEVEQEPEQGEVLELSEEVFMHADDSGSVGVFVLVFGSDFDYFVSAISG